MTQILWTPSLQYMEQSRMKGFMNRVNQEHLLHLETYHELHQWSIAYPDAFWKSVWKFCGLRLSKTPIDILKPGAKMRDARWFTGAQMNFAENLLQRSDEGIALIYESESGEHRILTYAQLFQAVAKLANHLNHLGVRSNDRVVGMMPNLPETIIAMLATASLGAVWSACSPDFGVDGILDRFSQIEPKVLFAVQKHSYKGKWYDHDEKIERLQKNLPSLLHTILVPYSQKEGVIPVKNCHLYPECTEDYQNEIAFEPFPFDHPLYILYSSGTTGKPKCIVHGAGNTLIQHLKEHQLHTNLTPESRFFFYTTCSWMMWNWLVSGLASGATLVLYEGSPFHPKPSQLFDLIDKAQINIFGVSAKFLESCEKMGLNPYLSHSLNSLKTLLTTGSPLLPESFTYVYEKIKPSVQLSSISGGTDIVSCFALGNPLKPVIRGELQSIGLGMNVKVFNNEGQPVVGEKGELVCTQPFPSMPLYFWNDPKGELYDHAYFQKYRDLWTHGDFAELTPDEGLIIYGRSDATLNPGGIRMGTAEIYSPLENISEITECLVIGQQWKGDERVVLFVVLGEGYVLTHELKSRIKKIIQTHASPRHVPDKIIQVPDLPRTKSGKISELMVKDIIHGKKLENTSSLENPNTLEYFKNIEELKY